MTQLEQIYTSITRTQHGSYICGESLIIRKTYGPTPIRFYTPRVFINLVISRANVKRKKALSISIEYCSVKYLTELLLWFLFSQDEAWPHN